MAKITMYVIFEGCLASGKTTTAKLLGKKYSTSSVLLENASIHPFLSDFYGNRKLYSVETELNFVLIHYHQLKKAEQGKIFAYDVFGDFLIDKDIIFANVTLKDETMEYKLFLDLFTYCKARVRTPDLVVYLRAPTDLIFERMRKRGRESERNVEFGYVDAINASYDKFFQTYRDTRVKTIDVTQIDRLSEDEIGKVVDSVRKID